MEFPGWDNPAGWRRTGWRETEQWLELARRRQIARDNASRRSAWRKKQEGG